METEAYGINPSGQIVGRYQDTDHNFHGFLFNQGSYTTLDPPRSM
jgi:probable HAF family extracellular repeat protein